MTPDDLCKSGLEHCEQAALFAWCNCAAQYGFEWADDDRCYDIRTRPALALAGVAPKYEVPLLSRLFAIHNQGHGDKIRGARAKAEGVKSGVPDMMLPVPSVYGHHGLFIELKQRKYKNASLGGVSDAQDDWIAYLRSAQYHVRVAYGWREAADILKWYLSDAKEPRSIGELSSQIVNNLR